MKTISQAAGELIYLALCLTILFISFTGLAYLMFANALYEFHTYKMAAITLLSTLLGKFNVRAMILAEGGTGKVSFLRAKTKTFFLLSVVIYFK